MKLYLVRHGQSKSNILEVHQTGSDPLTDEGLQQAKAVATRFKTIPADIIISSDFIRAKQTAEEIKNVIKKEIVFTPLLRERMRPSVIHGKRYDSPEAREVISLLHENRHDPEFRHSDEETFFDAIKRVKELVALVETRKEKSIVVVAHAAILKFLMTFMIFGEESNPDHFYNLYNFLILDNTGISICEKGEGHLDVMMHKDRWHLVTWNDHAHLG